MGIQGTVLDWFKNYLKDRYQSVHVSGTISSSKHLTFGFPQGSHIGPQGSYYYTDEVSEIAEGHVSAHLYADDTQLYLSFSLTDHEAEQAVLQMEDCIDNVKKSMVLNKLKVNEDKTELLIVLPSHHTHKRSTSSISIRGLVVRQRDLKAFEILVYL